MSAEELTDHGFGYVVDSKESEARYAVSVANFNPDKHEKVRPLQPGETVLGFRPKRLKTNTPKPAEPGNPALPKSSK